MTDELHELLRAAEDRAPRPNVRPIRLADLERRAHRARLRRAATGAIAAATVAALCAFWQLREVAPPPSHEPDWDAAFACADAALATTAVDAVDLARIRALETARVRALIATARIEHE